MYIKVASGDRVSLEDADNFRDFYIAVEDGEDISTNSVFQRMATAAGEGHYWIEEWKLVEMAGRTMDKAWQAHFQDMLEKVEPHGFYDSGSRRVKAHVKRGR